jgi:hypothetical protein
VTGVTGNKLTAEKETLLFESVIFSLQFRDTGVHVKDQFFQFDFPAGSLSSQSALLVAQHSGDTGSQEFDLVLCLMSFFLDLEMLIPQSVKVVLQVHACVSRGAGT